MQRTTGSCPDGVRYYSVHLTELDAEIMACVCGRAAAEAYLRADDRDYKVMLQLVLRW